MSESLQFVPMGAADLDAVVANEQMAFSHPWSRKLFEDGLSSYQCWVLRLDEQIIGHGVLQFILDEAHLLNITVAPKYQGRGFGRALLEHLMQQAKARDSKECFLELRASNQSAYGLYESYGFNEIGRRRNYYPAAAGREDALVMVCTLLD